jgi:CRP-like cAMP-binding protein
MADSKHPLHDQIRSLVPVNGLAAEYQDQIADQAEVIHYRRGRYVFHQGDRDGYAFYLLEGRIELYADDRLAEQVTAGTERARYALAQLQPRQLSAKAKTAVKVVRIERAALDKWLTMEHQGSEGASAASTEEAEDSSSDWMTCMLQSEIFGRIPAANIQRIFACMEEVAFNAGDVVVRQGTPGDFYYIVREGRCAVSYAPSPASKSVLLAELGVGDSFGEEALVANATRNATVTMLTDGRLMRLTKDDFLELIKKPTLESVVFSEAQSLVEQGARWLDVRFPDEYGHAALQGSVNLPLNLLRTQMKALEPGTKYVVYCDTGSRSAAGAFLLAQHGFEVAHLAGGLTQSPLSEATNQGDLHQEIRQPEGSIADDDNGRGSEQTKDSTSIADTESEARLDLRGPTAGKSGNDATGVDAPLNVDLRVSALKAELAKASVQLEEAVRLKTRADSERRAAVEQAQRKVRKERQRLGEESARASEAFSEAQRLRKELEIERKKGEAAAARRRQEEETLLRQLEEQTAQRIREQEARLEAEADQQLEEIVRLTTEADKARHEAAEEVKRSLERERQRLEEELACKREAEENRILHLRADAERRLQEEQANREHEMERRLRAAVRLKDEAEAAKRAAEVAIEERLRQERQHIEHQAAQANEALAEAQRLKRELEEAKRAVEEEAARKHEQEEERIRRLTEEAEIRLKTEQHRLQEEYERHAQELARFQEAKQQAQARWEEERRQLAAATVEAKQRMVEVEKKGEKIENSRRSMEEDLERMRSAHEVAEQRLREELAERLAFERQRLEAEFGRNMEAMEQLRQQKLTAEAARHAAAQEAERLIEKQKAAFLRMRREAEAERQKQQQSLEKEIKLLKAALGETGQGREPAVGAGHQRMSRTVPGQESARLDKKSGKVVRAALHREKVHGPPREQESLGERLEREMREWVSQEGTLAADGGREEDSEARWQRIKSKADAAKKAAQNANANLLYEVATQLSQEDK